MAVNCLLREMTTEAFRHSSVAKSCDDVDFDGEAMKEGDDQCAVHCPAVGNNMESTRVTASEEKGSDSESESELQINLLSK